MAKRAGRKKNQLPDCYYEGYLEKVSTEDQKSQKLWTCLCGNTLFFFNEKRDNNYVDKMDLSGVTSVTDDSGPTHTLDLTRFKVELKSETIKFTAPNAEARELWKGFMHSVAQLSVPSPLNLLPGQICMLEDVVRRETERLANVPSSTVTDHSPSTSKSTMPACFYEVPRLEAELLLEREANNGNLLLRPGSNGSSFAISTRLDLNESVFKHYRVLCRDGGFNIDVDTPVRCDTLQGIVDYLVQTTNGALTPLVIEGQYDKNISFVSSDNENGEKTRQELPNSAKPARLHSKQAYEKVTAREAEPVGEENPSGEEKKKESGDYPPATQSQKTAPRTALMPPTPVPRKSTAASSTVIPTNNVSETWKLISTDSQKKFPLPALSELKLKLQQKKNNVD